MILLIFYFIFNIVFVNGWVRLDWETRNPAFDPNLYTDALDSEQCESQLQHITDNALLRMRFLDAGVRLPRGLLDFNFKDMGNYHQCLGIDEVAETMHIEGKYCSISISTNTETMASNDIMGYDVFKDFKPSEEELTRSEALFRSLREINGVRDDKTRAGATATGLGFNLAVCIPKPCTLEEGINGILVNLNASSIQFSENFCRFQNDKPWAPADTVAIVIFSSIGLLTLVSTAFDLVQIFFFKRDPKEINKLCQSFSVYTNCRRLTTFATNPGSLECLDGIRSISMMWVIVGHTYTNTAELAMINTNHILDWLQDIRSLWISSAPVAVDTFFMMSGLLLVYTTANKFTGMKLLKNLHIFYLSRFLRMLPLLATAILLQISIVHRIADGPNWTSVAGLTDACRTYWWTTMLYVQNYVTSSQMCLPHSWYLAVDMQLYMLSPFVLFFVLGRRKAVAWSTLAAVFLIVLTASTVYIFSKNLPATILALNRMQDLGDYMKYYYFNTFTRASPFIIGMIFGYILHLYRGKELEMHWVSVLGMWVITFTVFTGAIFVMRPMASLDYSNQLLDNFTNSFQRTAWALALGWLVFACAHGFGGPINWFLSLPMWKLPSRISYGMYLFHFSIQYIIGGMKVMPMYFSDANTIYNFIAQFMITFVVAFVLTLLIDSPFSTLFKLILTPGNSGRKNNSAPRAIENNNEINNEVKMSIA